MTATECLTRMNEIDAKIAAGQYQDAFTMATDLEKAAKGYGSYHLGLLYHLGWGVAQDIDKAKKYYENALSIDNDWIKWVWYMGGLLRLNITAEYEEAQTWLAKAIYYGLPQAYMYLGCADFNVALQYRTAAQRTFQQKEMLHFNEIAVKKYIAAQEMYLKGVEHTPDKMTFDHWICFGRCPYTLYAIACRGEMSLLDSNKSLSNKDDLIGLVSVGANIVFSRADDERNNQWLTKAVEVFEVMDRQGWSIIGEYFRAACALIESELQHSAEAFYRARWHFKKIGELRSQIDPTLASNIAQYLNDVNSAYDKMEKKYGNMVVQMMQQGKLPDLTPSYTKGNAPAPESCQNFMEMLRELPGTRNRFASNSEVSKNKKKGLFGFFK